MNHIEVEIRAEIAQNETEHIKNQLQELGFLPMSSTHRVMLMSFGSINHIEDEQGELKPQETDIRLRVTNGVAEIAVKLGTVQSSDRMEMNIPVSHETLVSTARWIGSLNMFHKVGTRFTSNFTRDHITASLVSTKSGISYLELEILADTAQKEAAQAELEALAHTLGVSILTTREAYLEFVGRMTTHDDWRFHGTEDDIVRFIKEIDDEENV